MPEKKSTESSLVVTVPQALMLKAVVRAREENMSNHDWVNPIVVAALEANL